VESFQLRAARRLVDHVARERQRVAKYGVTIGRGRSRHKSDRATSRREGPRFALPPSARRPSRRREGSAVDSASSERREEDSTRTGRSPRSGRSPVRATEQQAGHQDSVAVARLTDARQADVVLAPLIAAGAGVDAERRQRAKQRFAVACGLALTRRGRGLDPAERRLTQPRRANIVLAPLAAVGTLRADAR
jgi:hypothetical protein